MADSKVNRENYIVIQGFMIKDLKLKGTELLTYAAIYGFTQSERQTYTGSLQYLAEWTNSTRQGVLRCLKSLVEKGFIEKTDVYKNGVKFCEYRSNNVNTLLNKCERGVNKSLTGGVNKSLTNNIVIENIEDIIDDNKEIKKEKKKVANGYDAILGEIEDESLRDLFGEYIKMRKMIKSPMTDRALKMLVAKVFELEPTETERQKRLLETAIINNWKSVYPLKDDKASFGNPKPKETKSAYQREMEKLAEMYNTEKERAD